MWFQCASFIQRTPAMLRSAFECCLCASVCVVRFGNAKPKMIHSTSHTEHWNLMLMQKIENGISPQLSARQGKNRLQEKQMLIRVRECISRGVITPFILFIYDIFFFVCLSISRHIRSPFLLFLCIACSYFAIVVVVLFSVFVLFSENFFEYFSSGSAFTQ